MQLHAPSFEFYVSLEHFRKICGDFLNKSSINSNNLGVRILIKIVLASSTSWNLREIQILSFISWYLEESEKHSGIRNEYNNSASWSQKRSDNVILGDESLQGLCLVLSS